VEIVVIDVRERELTIKGQEILTADKVAIRVSILTQFQVVDPVAAVERVVSYEDRLYSGVQLAARRALALMTLEQILTSRNQLSEDILSAVTDAAAGYGVKVLRADVKDLIFPGNLQEIMNRVLTAERLSQAQLVEARTKAEREAIEARSRAAVDQMTAQSQAAVQSIRAEADAAALRVQAEAATVYAGNPALLRVCELEGAVSAQRKSGRPDLHRLRQAPGAAAARCRLSLAITRPPDSAPSTPDRNAITRAQGSCASQAQRSERPLAVQPRRPAEGRASRPYGGYRVRCTGRWPITQRDHDPDPLTIAEALPNRHSRCGDRSWQWWHAYQPFLGARADGFFGWPWLPCRGMRVALSGAACCQCGSSAAARRMARR